MTPLAPLIILAGPFLYDCETLRYDVESLLEMPAPVRAWYKNHIKNVLTPEQYTPWMKAFNWLETHPGGELPECDALDRARGKETPA